jgi:DNA-binding MarR family transcriptional regulator
MEKENGIIVGCICGNAIDSDKGEHNFINERIELTPEQQEKLKKSIQENIDKLLELFRKYYEERKQKLIKRNEELKELCKNIDYSKLPKPIKKEITDDK